MHVKKYSLKIYEAKTERAERRNKSTNVLEDLIASLSTTETQNQQAQRRSEQHSQPPESNWQTLPSTTAEHTLFPVPVKHLSI